jgi:hypothetical protein
VICQGGTGTKLNESEGWECPDRRERDVVAEQSRVMAGQGGESQNMTWLVCHSIRRNPRPLGAW